MAKPRAPYPAEFRRQILVLARSGRSPARLAKQFEATAQSIHNLVEQADLDEGYRTDGLQISKRDELTRRGHEKDQLKFTISCASISPIS